jgi:2-iminobutanoate/2-iminopropanoate deaminase
LKALLEVVEMDFSNVLKATIFISDMDNYSIVNEIYASYFEEKSAPARETVEVSRLPKSVRIEISMIAAL